MLFVLILLKHSKNKVEIIKAWYIFVPDNVYRKFEIGMFGPLFCEIKHIKFNLMHCTNIFHLQQNAYTKCFVRYQRKDNKK